MLTNITTEAKTKASQLPGSAFARKLISHFREDDVTGMAAETAFYWIFSIPPMMILIVMTAALLDDVANVDIVGRLRAQIERHAPDDTVAVLNRLVDNGIAEVNGGLASVSVVVAALLAIWSGANGMGAMMKAFNRAYEVGEERTYLRKRAVAIGLTVFLVVFLNAAFVLVVYGLRIGTWLTDRLGAGDVFEQAWQVLRWPAVLIFISLALMALYRLGPNVDQAFRETIPGAIVAMLLWLVAVSGIGIYLQFSNPGSAYGALGGIIVLLFFLYVTAIILLVGAEINVVLRQDP
ncbi:MAG: YihY/virulence factor BrkB family protein [Thermomicrobiales bacterium]